MSDDRENYNQALRFQKEGKYKEALAAAYRISDPVFRASILIDSGTDARKPSIIREGVRLFEDALKAGHSQVSRSSLLYNIGNGYSAIFQIRLMNGAKLIAPNDDDLRQAKRAYRSALAETKGNTPSLRSQTLVNYGNCLSSLGRCFEAVEAYSLALELEPRNGMAAGNLGIELDRAAQITDRYIHHYLLAAHDVLSKACSPEMDLSYGGPSAARRFRAKLGDLQAIIDAHKGKLAPLMKISFAKTKTAKDRYILFCLKNKLFLNAWVGDQDVAPAISDEIAFGGIAVRQSNSQTVPELLRILNEIKEAFSTARYLLYLSQSTSKTLDDISLLTSYFAAHTKDLNGLPTGLCKSAYSRAFDVLDKVARIVNVYFGIGKRRDYFWDVLAEKQSRGQAHEIRFVARPSVVSSYNYSLYALSDLCIDYFESEHVDFKTIDTRRNRITHDYLAVLRGIDAVAADSEITASELYRQTLAVLRLAKYATLYAVSALHIAERKKGSPKNAQKVTYWKSAGLTSKMFRKSVRA